MNMRVLAFYFPTWYYDLMPKLHGGRRYDLWWEDPFKYAQHLRASGECNVYFTYSKLMKRNMDAYDFMRFNFHGMKWKCYINNGYSTDLIDYTCERDEIRGCWPTWNAGDGGYDLMKLKDLIERPWAERDFNEGEMEWFERPVRGQKHRIFIQDLAAGRPHEVFTVNRRRRLSQIQRLHPEVEFFIKPTTFHMPLLFGCGFSAGCLDPYAIRGLRKGAVYFPNGRYAPLLDLYEHRKKIEYFGFDVDEVMNDQDQGLLYMLASVRYAAHHWDDPTGLYLGEKPSGRPTSPDWQSPDMYAELPSYDAIKQFKLDSIKPTDKILCDSCSLWRLCPAYRSEEVCGLPGTESKRLSQLAKSRNADDIVDMLAAVLSKQAERVEDRLDHEEDAPGGHDKDIDKMLNNVFKNGTTLAKLRNPSLGRPLVQVNTQVNGAAAAIQQVAEADPRELAASVISAIEATGVSRENITQEMVSEYMAGLSPKSQLESGSSDDIIDAEFADG